MDDLELAKELEANERVGKALKKHINGSVQHTVERVLFRFFAWGGLALALAILAGGIAWGKAVNQIETNKTSIEGINANLSNINSALSQQSASVAALNSNLSYLLEIFRGK